MTKKEKVLSSIIGFLLVVVAIVGYKAYDYRKNLLEKKKIIVQKDKNFLEGMKVSYEMYTRLTLVDKMRTYAIRHPFNAPEVEFQTALRKAGETQDRYLKYLEKQGFKDYKLTNLINSEKKDFLQVSDKIQSYDEILQKEDEKNNKDK